MKFRTIICFVVLILNSESSSHAQLPATPPVLETEKVERSIERLNREIQRTQDATSITETTSTPRQSFETITNKLRDEQPRSQSRIRLRSEPKAAIESNQDDSELTVPNDIFDRIDLLKKINRERSNAAPNLPNFEQPLQDTVPLDVSNNNQREMLPEPLPNQAMDDASIDPTAGSSSNLQPSSTTSAIATDRVLPEPVNAFEMGNSLFQTGRIETALEAYNAVDTSTMNVFDATWLNFMKATCNRKLGNVNEATAAYRQISNERNAPNLVDASVWWLKHNQQLNAIETNFEQIQLNINSAADRMKNYENR